LTSEDTVVPTPAQWRAAIAKISELLQLLKDAQAEIEQLKAERDSLNKECLALSAKNDELHSEIS
jgi:peptidoglycan hydrolase CwlO-like protein